MRRRARRRIARCWCAARRSRCYPHLRLGLPAERAPACTLWRGGGRTWCTSPPKGRWAGRRCSAARELELPVTLGLPHQLPGLQRATTGWAGCAAPILAYLRRFHNRTRLHDGADRSAARASCRRPASSARVVVARGVDTQLFDPARRSDDLRRHWGVADGDARGAVRRPPGGGEEPRRAAAGLRGDARRSTPRLRLVLVGDGPLRAALRAALPRGGVRRPAQRRPTWRRTMRRPTCSSSPA